MLQYFLDEWKKACATDGGTLSVPKGNYELSDIEFSGPCNGETNFVLEGTITAPEDPTPDIDHWIMFHQVDSLSISGTGTLDGNGASYWRTEHDTTIAVTQTETYDVAHRISLLSILYSI